MAKREEVITKRKIRQFWIPLVLFLLIIINLSVIPNIIFPDNKKEFEFEGKTQNQLNANLKKENTNELIEDKKFILIRILTFFVIAFCILKIVKVVVRKKDDAKRDYNEYVRIANNYYENI